jgi:ferric-dicitrate binding protein FerR (iron transport regulator)
MDPKITAELLDRFLNDRCTPEEVAVVNDWINSFDNDDDYISNVSSEQALLIKNRMRDNILDRIAAANDNVVELNTERKSRRISFGWRWMAAASILLIAFLSIYYLKDKIATTNEAAVPQFSFVNNTGGLQKLTLPDKSQVWLNPKSTITYPRQFNKTYRLIQMKGECFFEITKGATWPFIIESKHLVTKVWGTSFRIRDNEQLTYADVTVLTGKVSVSPNNGNKKNIDQLHTNEVMLYPKQKALLPAAASVITKQSQDGNEGMKMWNKMSLAFDKTSVREMIPILEKQYNIKIAVNDPQIMNEELNADFESFNLADVLTVFEKTLDIKYTIVNNTITFSR